ncbi:2OG-Fe(II) oxygenase [Sneathiella marina]|uniref:2OG-Fe(II) oxygenase n=1 Tax=Sneathiella marina TaxID=2950108 RepID=A0ABY4VZT3_9PROT|nr:2OG-Fe(II) oxygenase [Sneathiella marina]USG60348.1 2OG-Fe(II) oxygenase [Sneathiella marina]
MGIDWTRITEDLNSRGFSCLRNLLTETDCTDLVALYDEEDRFRNRVVMQQHGYGQGEYRYFSYPLPDQVSSLREQFYQPLSVIANDWSEKLKADMRYPDHLEDYTDICHRSGQRRPTPLLLKYKAGDYNRLHQDLYGEHVFPLQMAILLNQPGADFTGGEFVVTEQSPRMQSRATVVGLNQGDALIFAVNDRPRMGLKRMSRLKMRHGVSEITSGNRHTLGIIFHDAT